MQHTRLHAGEILSACRTEADRLFILVVVRPLSPYRAHTHTHSQREAVEGSCWVRLILAGELRANPFR